MAELKTQRTKASVAQFIAAIPDEQQRKDAKKLLAFFKEVTGERAAMWGSSIVGFGKYHYKSTRSKQEGDWFYTGFSPRKNATTLYVYAYFTEHAALIKKLGKVKTGVCCIYVKRLEDIDLKVLKKLVTLSLKELKKNYS